MSYSADNVIKSIQDQSIRLRNEGDYQLAREDIVSMLILFKAILFPEREMDIESAVEMLKSGKARVQQILLER